MKNFAILIMLALWATCSYAQTAQSDELFARGVELYNTGHYADAITVFGQCDSVDHATMDTTSARYGYTKMWLASCWHKLGKDSEARKLSPYYYTQPPLDRRLTVEADSLEDLAIALDNEGRHAEATPLYLREAEIIKGICGENSVAYATTLTNYGFNIWESTHEVPRAEEVLNKAQDIFKQLKATAKVADTQYAIALMHFFLPNSSGMSKAAELFMSSAEDREASGDSIYAGVRYRFLTASYTGLREFQKAADAARHGLRLLDGNKDDVARNNHAMLQSMLANSLFHQAEYTDATATAEKALGELVAEGLRNTDFYNNCSLIIAVCALETGDSNGLAMLDNAWRTADGYGQGGQLLSLMVSNLLNDKTAQDKWSLLSRYTSHIRTLAGEETPQYVRALVDAAHVVDANADIFKIAKDSIRNYLAEATRIIDTGVDPGPQCAAAAFGLKGRMETNIFSQFDKAETDLTKARLLLEKNNMTDGAYYRSLIVDIANLHKQMGRNDDAFNDYQLAYRLYSQADSIQDYGFFQTLSGLADYYSTVGDSKRYEEFRAKAEALAMAKGWDNMLTADTEKKIASVLTLLNQRQFNEAYDIARQYVRQGRKNDNCSVGGLVVSAYAYLANGHKDDAKELADKAMEKMLKSDRVNMDYALAGGMISMVYMLTGQYQMGLDMIDISAKYVSHLKSARTDYKAELWQMKTLMEFMAFNSEEYQTSIFHNTDTLLALIGRMFADIATTDSLVRKVVTDNFLTMTYDQRTMFWNKNKNWFQTILPNIVLYNDDEGTGSNQTKILYNSQLLSKGLMLNSEAEIHKLIADNGQEEHLQWLNRQVQEDRMRLDSLTRAGANENHIKYWSDQLDKDEHSLLSWLTLYGDYTKRLLTTFDDVSKTLERDEAAVEFVMKASPFSADTTYYALRVERWDLWPDIIRLCTSRDLAAIPKDSIYSGNALFHLVWEKLLYGKKKMFGRVDSLSANVRRIYFAPAGQLYGTAIEYARMPDGQPINQKYEMHRLSSTREIALRGEHRDNGFGAILYGGLKYDAGVADVEKADESLEHKDNDRGIKPRAAVSDDEGIGGGMPYLSGTLKEVNAIGSMLTAADKWCHEYTGDSGTEGSLKSWSGQNLQMLHIATHGFYWNGKGGSGDDGLMSLLSSMAGSSGTATQEDRMLTRSGLIMAGANTALRGGSVPQNLDDGILTSLELSQLDFNSLDLVVLSACETGLGEVSGEGVFGLQRGFKKAGAGTLLMSLWKVDDDATQILMTEFYRNLLSGKSKTVSLANAQQHLRTVNGGKFDNPRYWAAFILLDAE